MNKHILVISQYFYPEQFRINDIALEWVKRGYQVTVVTGMPNYPEGEFYPGYNNQKRREEIWNGITIIRLPILPRKSGYINLIKNYWSFVNEGYRWVKETSLKTDIVYTFEVSPMTQALVGIKYAKKEDIPHYLYVTDLWPENIASVTGIGSKMLLYPIQKMVDYIYNNSQHILTCSQSFIPKIIARNISKSKVEFWPQYAEEFYKPVSKTPLRELPPTNVTRLMFAGNMGKAQGLDILVSVAELLKLNGTLLEFVLIGEGRHKAELERLIIKNNLADYFNFIERKPAIDIPSYYAHADALLITLEKSEVFALTLPAKTQSCFSSGKPIIVSADGEINKLVKEARAGFASEARDVSQLYENILHFINLTLEEKNQMGQNAYRYAKEKFDKKTLMDRMDIIFNTTGEFNES